MDFGNYNGNNNTSMPQLDLQTISAPRVPTRECSVCAERI